MKFQILCILILLCMNIESSIFLKKITQKKDMSEYCRRRVVPSVFLGRQVAEASAEVMEFSRLDVPYSCSMSIRTESGSNIILVIQLKVEESLTNSCNEGHDQVLVYEIGETFGGYWGALPERMLNQETQNSTVYTLKSMRTTAKSIDIQPLAEINNSINTESILPVTSSQAETGEGNYFVMEIPLVNVSGNVELGEPEVTHSEDDDLFDLIYDVTPRNGVLYETSVMPLVQFSVWKQQGQQREGVEDLEPRYQLDYSLRGFTPDYRTINKFNNNRRNFSNRPYYSTRRLKFKKKNKELFGVNRNRKNKNQVVLNTPFKFYTQPTSFTKISTKATSNYNEILNFANNETYTESWQKITSNFGHFTSNNSMYNSKGNKENDTALLENIFNMNHNISAHSESDTLKYVGNNLSSGTLNKKLNMEELLDNNNTQFSSSTLPMSENIPPHLNTTKTSSSHKNTSLHNVLIISELSQAFNNTERVETTKKDIVKPILNLKQSHIHEYTSTAIVNISINVDGNEEMKDLQSTTKLYSQLKKDLTKTQNETSRKSGSTGNKAGSLVDHESWENVVQIAPVMADLLNVTSLTDADNLKFSAINSKDGVKRKKRKKRFIQALNIEQNRPRQLSTTENKATTSDFINELFDSQDLAEVVELQDDEIQGRVALRYFNSYVGTAMLNICDAQEALTRHIYLFNSSRIVISINNFSINNMMIVLTETRMVRGAGCPSAHLECQVSGARVCVHRMNACDGVPNCGTRDLYDEDRLLCGNNVGFEYSVWLAACIFLAVLLTLLYSVYYWLKRCVPKVSQAFFVYTDKSENILYLDSIMRSPTDFDTGSRLVYNSNFFESDLSSQSSNEDDRKCVNLMRRFLNLLFCKKVKEHFSKEINPDLLQSYQSKIKRKFSFTELELLKNAPIRSIDASVQTGDSLALAHSKKLNEDPQALYENFSRPSLTTDIKISPLRSENELDMLRRLRGVSASFQSSSGSDMYRIGNFNICPPPVEEEVELHTTMYDRVVKGALSNRDATMRTSCEVHSGPSAQKSPMTKHLRFEEVAVTIPSPSVYSDEDGNANRHRRMVLGDDNDLNLDVNTPENIKQPTASSGIDFMRFWGSGKNKKSKKTTHLSLR